MEKDITARDFARICKEYGFTQKKKKFYKLCGDGVLQIVGSARSMREYVDYSSPYYSEKHKKSDRIGFSIHSIYGAIYDFIFDIEDKYTGFDFYTDNLYGMRAIENKFLGIQYDYRRMVSDGFPLLEQVQSQQILLQTLEKLLPVTSTRMDFDMRQCGLQIVCGHPERAFEILSIAYTKNWTGICSYNFNLAERDPNAFIEKVRYFKDQWAPFVDLWWGLFRKDQDRIMKYLHDSYIENMRRIEEFGIPIPPDFHPIDEIVNWKPE